MIKAIMITSAFVLMAFLTSCSEKKEEVAAETTTPEPAPVPELPAKPEIPTKEKILKQANKKLGWVMQDLDNPAYNLDKFHKKGEFMTENYVKFATKIIAAAKTIKDISHPDEKLTGLANDMLGAMGKYEEAFNAKDTDKLKTSYEALKVTCAACHKIYKKDSGGY